MSPKESRFEVSRTSTTLKLEARGIDGHFIGRVVRFGSLALLVACPAAFALFAPDVDRTIPFIAFVSFGAVAAFADLLHMVQTRILETPTLGRVRRSLTVVRSDGDVDHRHPPERPALTIDGRTIDPDERPLVAVSRVVFQTQVNGGRTSIRHHVSIVLRRRVIRVAMFEQLGAATLLAQQLAEALDADAEALTLQFEVPVASGCVGLAVIVVGLLVQFATIGAAVLWAATTDRFDGATPTLPLAAIATFALNLLAQEAGFRFLAPAAAAEALTTYGIDPGDDSSLRGTWIASAAWAVAAIGLGIVVGGERASYIERGHFDLGGDQLALFDVDGDGAPDPIGFMSGTTDRELVALDARTGKRLWSHLALEHTPRIVLEPQPLVIGSNDASRGLLLTPFDPKTGAQAWTAQVGAAVIDPRLPSWWHVDSRFLGASVSEGCLLVHLGRQGASFMAALDLASGKACPTITSIDEPVAEREDVPPLTEAEMLDLGAVQEHTKKVEDQIQAIIARRGAYEKQIAPFEAEEKAQKAKQRDPDPVVRALVDGDVRYEIGRTGGLPERLTLTASRGATTLWSARLDAAPIRGLPFVVGGGVVVVAGVDLHGGDRLHLLGIDAATGAIRYVRRHPSKRLGPTEMVLSGGVALIAWAMDLRGYDPGTGKLLWSTGTP